MKLQKNSSGRLELVPDREAGVEGLALSGFAAPDLSLDGDSLGVDGALEYSAGGTLYAAAYSGLLKFLELEPARKAGIVTRAQQISETKSAAWQFAKNKAVYIILIGTTVALLPGLAPVFGVLGIIGLGTSSYKLIRQFYSALNEEQIEALRVAAENAGVDIQVPERSAEDESVTEPSPVFA